MPHIPGHRGSNAFTGFENIRQRMEGLTPPAPFIAQAPVQSIIERIQQSPEYLQNLYSGPNWTPLTPSFVPNTFVPGGRSGTVPPRFGGRSMRLGGLGAPLDISSPPTVAPVVPAYPGYSAGQTIGGTPDRPPVSSPRSQWIEPLQRQYAGRGSEMTPLTPHFVPNRYIPISDQRNLGPYRTRYSGTVSPGGGPPGNRYSNRYRDQYWPGRGTSYYGR